MIKSNLFSVFLFCSIFFVKAQNEGNWWYFGENAGINFNTSPPTAVADGAMDTFEGCSAISDNNGNLLFYTDGSTVWDRNHVVMPNGTGLPGNRSSAQSSLIVKDHQLADVYYIFCVGINSTKLFSKVDMTMNNGFGDIVPGFKNVDTGVSVNGERVHATLNPIDNSTWLIYGSEGIFELQSIRNGILSPTVGHYDFSQVDSLSYDNRGQIKFSPDGLRVAFSAVHDSLSTLMLMDFDPSNGQLSSPKVLGNPYGHPQPPSSGTQSVYGFEFSPNSTFLYADLNKVPRGNHNSLDNDKRLVQYDLNGPPNWEDNPALIYENIGQAEIRGSLQLAPDGKIYYARPGTQWLGVIDRPNELGASANYIHDGIQLPSGAICNEGLTNVATYIYNGSNAIGPQYEVNGHITVDVDANGCSSGNTAYPFSIINVQQNQANFRIAVDANGNYRYGLPSGQHTLTPIPENPSFWNISPSSVTIDFPTQASPFTQDFCMTPVGNMQDLEVNVIALQQGRPGFDTDYRVIVRNLGNQTIDGTVSLTFEDNYMNLVSTSPTVTSQSGAVLTWDFTGLAPFAAINFDFTMNLNTPTDANFPLNSGDILSFTGDVTGPHTDQNPLDNNLTLDQTVVNSYDPNDIICIEGENIGLADVGEYVHYLIRFENLGTASAINVVLQNQIDLTKFDINTLIPISSSHNFTTRINAEGMAEFTFQDINLDFNDATNDGYLLYKIKTVDTLVEGDTFSNQADIFFDFNPAITTNNYTTTVQATASTRDVQDRTVSIYPNPASNMVNIRADYSIESLQLFDLQGREVLSKNFEDADMQRSVDLGNIHSGVYFLRASTSKGTNTQKLILR